MRGGWELKLGVADLDWLAVSVTPRPETVSNPGETNLELVLARGHSG
jgi:hypothetical protein